MNKCKYCINKDMCESCYKPGYDNFIPNNDVRKYFTKEYNGVRGIDGYTYIFDTTNESLIPTHSILIHGHYYCAYCGDEMGVIQDKHSLSEIGYCCICDGARAELEYEDELKRLEKYYKAEKTALRNKYSEKLVFNIDRLVSIKHRLEYEQTFRPMYHFSTINDKKIRDIDQLL